MHLRAHQNKQKTLRDIPFSSFEGSSIACIVIICENFCIIPNFGMLRVPGKVGDGKACNAVTTATGLDSSGKCVATPPRRTSHAQAPEEDCASVSSVGTTTVEGGGGVR